jgi:hypothetical protein
MSHGTVSASPALTATHLWQASVSLPVMRNHIVLIALVSSLLRGALLAPSQSQVSKP